ncbi:hypothetical protein AVEN_99603-1 [Araneus ventricosus]|uniref:Uncharacterized protein n=1 Tax=Araneus ventricosus TaxID=182803 RepID=A0A4Y2EQ21_ARAVE|nr:hypothetical protein AVEN_99603-1 [Araneus ventricosus]
MMREALGLVLPLQASAPHQRVDVGALRMIYGAAGPIHGGSPVESGFEPGTLRPRRRELSTRPPRPRLQSEKMARVLYSSFVYDSRGTS